PQETEGVEEIVIPGVPTAEDIINASEETPSDSEELVVEIEEPVEDIEEEITEETIVEAEEPDEVIVVEEVDAPAEDTEEAVVSAEVELDGEKNILVKYLGAATMSEDEVFEIVADMTEEEKAAAYDELAEYVKTLSEDEIENVSATLVYFDAAICADDSVQLFADLYYCSDAVLVQVDSNGSGTRTDDTTATITVKGSLISTKTTNVEVFNKSTKAMKVSFDYTIDKANTFKVDGVTTTSGGSITKDMDAGASIVFSLTAKSGWSGTTATLVLKNITAVELQDTNSITFDYDSAEGSVSVDGATVASGTAMDISYSTGATLAATAASGYTFMGWVNKDTHEIVAADGVLKPKGSFTVSPIFAKNEACFGIGSAYLFDDLNDAVAVASNQTNKVIYVKNNGTLPAGTYTIPAGVTLLVPFDDANTVYTTSPGLIESTYVQPTVYRTLTMENGAKLVVNGALSVSNKILSGNAGYRAGSPTGPLSMIKMNQGSNITVNNGGAAYVYGFIYGNGTMNIKSGATVYEAMQILDFRGGTCTTGMINNSQKVFVFNQYFVQNIEVPATYEPGATEYVVSSIYMQSKAIMTPVKFIGTSECMFVPTSGTMTKRFDPASGRLIVDASGDISLSTMKIALNISILQNYNIDTSKSVLPISPNITINMNSGTATINQDLALLPGTELNIGKDAVLNLASGRVAYAYDLDEWMGNEFCYGRTGSGSFWDGDHSWLTYTATTTSTKQTLKDAKIDVNGRIIGNGYLYTTAGGANITSSEGTGVVELVNWDPTENPVTYQMKLASGEFTEVPVTSVKLLNADGTYTETVNVVAGIAPTTGKYLYKEGKWSEWRPGIYFDANGGEGTMEPQYSDSSAEITLNANTFTRNGYDFMGWSTTPDGEVTVSDGAFMGIVEEEITLYAVWEKSACEHKNTEPAVPAEAATCTEPGTTAGLKCSDCQTVLEEPVEIPVNPDAHSFTSYTYNQDAKCEEDGTKTATCDNGCGATETVVAEGTALDHSFTSYTYNNDAKCEEDGTKTATCDNGCGTTETVVAEGTALGHSFTSYTYNNDAKCEEDGTKTATCDNGCGATETVVAEGTALEHSFTNYVSDNNATLTEDGTKTATCDNGCGKKDTLVDVGSRTGLKNINLTYTPSDTGMKFDAIVEGYKGTGRLFVAIYNAQGKLLTASFAGVVADDVATVTFGNVANASYAKVFAWDGCKPVATYKVQSL
ncbi:MAG: hypothetical protein E7417_03850, partial [Ruminococcaceae bacterium]|nr:hypothetical protein [Oscillospiraceae bacterium]